MRILFCFALVAVSCTSTAMNFHPLSDEFIDYINSKQSTWTAGRNFHIDTPRSKLQALVGVKGIDVTSPFDRRTYDIKQVNHSIPSSFDARDKWPECKSLWTVRDQSTCGSCWAIAAVEAMSDRICIHSNGKKQVSLSVEDLLSCCGKSCGDGCNGGYLAPAWNYWVKNGIVSGTGYQNTSGCRAYSFPPCAHHVVSDRPQCSGVVPTPACTKKCDNGSSIIYENDLSFGSNSYTVASNETQIQLEIMQYGPVEVAYVVFEDFLSYKSGVYQYIEGDAVGGHAVKVIGWGVENGTPYWLAVNSWNSDWGDKGYFKILRGVNHVGFESEVEAGMPKL